MLDNETSSDVVEVQASPEPASSEQAQPQVEKEPPFHEHPRFKELIEQNRAYKSSESELRNKMQQYEQHMQALQAQIQTKPNSYEPVLNRLKDIDPDFGSFQKHMFEKLGMTDSLKAELEEMKAWRAQAEAHKNTEFANTKLNELYTAHKVDDVWKDTYKNMIIAKGANAPVSALPEIFKSVHEEMSKLIDTVKRSERESYVSQKSKDARPASQTGGLPVTKKPGGMNSLDDVKSAFAKALRDNKI